MTDQYAVIGNPIAHSLSPAIHAAFARQTGQSLTYEAMLGPLDGFAGAVDAFRARGGRGINVTAPFKLDAFAYATDLSHAARLAGAVNAMKFVDRRVYAENFDGAGLVIDIERNIGFSIAGARVLLLGAGGAARGAMPALMARAPRDLVIFNRTHARAVELARIFADRGQPRAPATLKGLAFDLMINATSPGASFGGLPDGAARGLAYDMIYGQGLTPFLARAKEAGAERLVDGIGMLVEQAAAAFAWWRGVTPCTSDVIASLKRPLI
jgi:shikimate dehydrogenase